MKYFKSLPVQLLVILLVALFCGDLIPTVFKSFAYSISLTIKSCLIFIIPIIIFSYIFSCLVAFKDGTIKFLASLLGAVCASNFLSTMIAFAASILAFKVLGSISFSLSSEAKLFELKEIWNFEIPKLMSNDIALFAGVSIGVLSSFFSNQRLVQVSEKLKLFSDTVLNKIFVPVLPIFILGFVLKMQHDGSLQNAILNYGPVVLIFAVCQIVYLSLLYGVAANFNLKSWSQKIKTMIPAIFTGFSAMSSLAAMPMTIKAANSNTNNNPMVGVIVPATVNIHLIGDSIAIPTMALAIMMNFLGVLPDISVYLIFAFYFVVNKFAVAAVPGGGIIVMMPVLQQYLGFTDEMLSLITMLYIIFDPIITSVNVGGNGAFAMLFTKVYGSDGAIDNTDDDGDSPVIKAAA